MAALAAFNRKNSGLNGVRPVIYRLVQRSIGKIVALTAFNQSYSSVNGVHLEKTVLTGFIQENSGINIV